MYATVLNRFSKPSDKHIELLKQQRKKNATTHNRELSFVLCTFIDRVDEKEKKKKHQLIRNHCVCE